MQNKKSLYRLSKKQVLCLILALMMALTGCAPSGITGHALTDGAGIATSVTDTSAAVSDETVSLRETISDNLDDKFASQAAEVSEDYWKNDVPADMEEVTVGAAEQMVGDDVKVDTGATVNIDRVDADTVEKRFDENGLRQTTQFIDINYTTVNKRALKVNDLDKLFSENYEAYLSDCESKQPVYEVKGYDDMYVAFVDPTTVNGIKGELVDYVFVSGMVVNPVNEDDKITFDEEKGIVYIPKSLYFTGDGEEYEYDLAMQLMVAVDMDKTETDEYGNVMANVSVEVEDNRNMDLNIKTGTYSMVGFEHVVLDIVNPEDADKLSLDDFTVYLAGSAEPVDNKTDLSWNPETGNLTIHGQAMVTSQVKVVIKGKGILESVKEFFGGRMNASAAVIKNMDQVDGMKPVINVSTGKPITPSIEYEKLAVGDIYGYGENGLCGYLTIKAADALYDLGQKDFVYVATGSKQALLYRYLTKDGGKFTESGYNANLNTILNKKIYLDNIGDVLKGGNYTASNGGGVYFIQIAPYSYKDKESGTVKTPTLLYTNSNDSSHVPGVMVDFGSRSEWAWVNRKDDPDIDKRLKQAEDESTGGIQDVGTLDRNVLQYYYIGRCTHRNGNLLEGSDIDSGNEGDPSGTACKFCSDNCTCEHCLDASCRTACTDCCADILERNGELNTDSSYACIASVLAKTSNYVILGMTMTQNEYVQDGNPNRQVGTSIIKVMTESGLTVTKTANTDNNTVKSALSNNSCYADPATAVYGVYTKKNDTSSKIGEVKANGEDELKVGPGTYYIHETKVPKGFYPDDTWHEVKVTNGTKNVEVKDDPMVDPNMLVVQKAANDDDEAGEETGNITLEGIEFEVSYYKGEFKTINDLADEKPDEKAIFVTNSRGLIMLDARFLKQGETWKYKGDGNNLEIPLGTVYIKEKSSVKGLKIINSTGVLYTITDKSDKTDMTINPGTGVGGYRGTVTTYVTAPQTTQAASAYANQKYKGGVTVVKVDGDSNTSEPQGDATLAGAEYTIYNRSKKPVKYNGNTIPVDGAVTTITTAYDEASKTYTATTGNNVLQYGTYEIVETKAPEGYALPEWKQPFSIEEDGQMYLYTRSDPTLTPSGINWLGQWCVDPPIKGGVTVVKADGDWERSEAEGDADLAGAEFTVYNRSKGSIRFKGQKIAPGGVVTTITTSYDEETRTYRATTGNRVLPYGTYEIVETKAPTGYHLPEWKQTFSIRTDGEMKEYISNGSWCPEPPYRGGVSVVKGDFDWNESDYQGDATLEGTEYTIYNRSRNKVKYGDKEIAVGGIVDVITTTYDEATKTYKASTGNNVLAYGTYEVKETKAPEGYNLTDWSRTFTIREPGEMHNYTQKIDADTANGLNWLHNWCVNPVKRGRVIIGKVSRETMQYTNLGAAKLAGATFRITNKSKHPVYVNGTTYGVNETVMDVTASEMEITKDGETKAIVAAVGEDLPYGTYEVREINTGIGYLYDTESKNQVRTFSIREEGETVYLTDEETDAFHNKVQREDFYFQKKANDSGKEMVKVAWTVTSITTGETHVIVTDENGKFDSEFIDHTNKTNSNDPDSPITNGAIKIDEHGHYYVADASKLDYDAGTWFTGLAPEKTKWAEDGKSYTVVGGTGHVAVVDDTLRAFPYDVYTVQELASDANEEYNLVSFTVTLKRYNKDPDSNGIKIDYGTVDDEHVDIYTNLGYNATGFAANAKSAPAVKELTVTDVINYAGLTAHNKYTMKGELHVVDKDGKDEGIVAANEITFEAKATGQLKMDFTLDASKLAGKKLVATQELWQGENLRAKEKDLTNEDETVWLSGLTGTRADKVYMGTKFPVTVTDEVDYVNLEIGTAYTVHMTLVDKETGEPIKDKNGNVVEKEQMFVPGTNTGTTKVSLTFDAAETLANTYGVVFEEITKGAVFGEHKDLNDEAQTVPFTDTINTYAANGRTYGKELAAKPGQSIRECVRLDGLASGKSYKLEGSVYWLDDDGNAVALLDGEGKAITKAIEDPKANEVMEFDNIDATELGGRDIVVYQMLYARDGESDDWELVFEHCDNTDEDQMLHVPKIGTTLVNEDGIHNAIAGDEITLTDTVEYENLTPGREYKMTGTLHVRVDEKTEDGYVTKDGGAVKDLTAEATFTPEEKNGSVDIVFTFDASELAGKVVVAFEELYTSMEPDIPKPWDEFFPPEEPEPGDKPDEPGETPEEPDGPGDTPKEPVADHEDITDTPQSVGFANIKCTTLTSEDGLHERAPYGESTLTDIVEYEGLIPGTTYDITGTLHVRGEDKPLTEVKGTFVPEAPNGSVSVTFTFDPAGLDGKTVTAYEVISYEDFTLAAHEDMDDELQSVHFTSINTIFTGVKEPANTDGDDADAVDTGKDGAADTAGNDTADETDVPDADNSDTADDPDADEAEGSDDEADNPDADEAEGSDDEANDPSDDEADGPDADKAEGSDDKAGNLDDGDAADDAKEPEDNAALEEAVDKITENKGAIKYVTFNVYPELVDEAGRPQAEIETIDLVDAVHLTNLTPGKKYTLKGEVHKKAEDGTDGGPIESYATVDFTPDKSDYMVVSVFHVTPEKADKADLVAFQYLYDGETLVGMHNDINDADQTVTIKPNVITPTEPEKPGVTPTEPEKPGVTPTEPDEPGNEPDGPNEPKNPCGCDEPDCKHKDEKDHCVNNPGCCDDSDCCKDCEQCTPGSVTPVTPTNPEKKPSSSASTKNPIQKMIEVIKTGQNLSLVMAIIGLVILSGGAYYVTKTPNGRRLFEEIRKKLAKLLKKE